MLEINLLTEDFYLRKKKRKMNLIIILSSVIAIILIFIFSGSLYYYNVTIKNDLDRINNRLAKLKPVVDNLKKVEEERETLEKKVQLIENLLKNQGLWAGVLDEINLTLGDGVYFKSMYNNDLSIAIDGMVVSTSQRAVEENFIQYLFKLKESKKFKDVNFSFRKTQAERNNVKLAFLIRCNLNI